MVDDSGVGVFFPLAGRGSEVDLVMVMCTQSWFSVVPEVKLFNLNGNAGNLKVFSRVPGLVVFWRVTSPLGSVLNFISVEATIDDFF